MICTLAYVKIINPKLFEFNFKIYGDDGKFEWNLLLQYFLFVMLNFLIIISIGLITIRAIVFPFSFIISKNVISGFSMHHYSNDFQQYADKCYIIM